MLWHNNKPDLNRILLSFIHHRARPWSGRKIPWLPFNTMRGWSVQLPHNAATNGKEVIESGYAKILNYCNEFLSLHSLQQGKAKQGATNYAANAAYALRGMRWAESSAVGRRSSFWWMKVNPRAHTPATQMPTPTSLPLSNLRGSWLYFEFDFDLVSSTVLQTDESGSTAAASRADQTRSG